MAQQQLAMYYPLSMSVGTMLVDRTQRSRNNLGDVDD